MGILNSFELEMFEKKGDVDHEKKMDRNYAGVMFSNAWNC